MTDDIERTCANCRHKKSSFGLDSSFWICKSPKNRRKISDNIGGSLTILKLCKFVRDQNTCGEDELCGPDGKWFEPKEKRRFWFW